VDDIGRANAAKIQNLTTIFVITSPRPHFLHNPGAPHIHFSSYTKPEAIAIVSRSVPSIYLSSPLEPTSTPDSDDLVIDGEEDDAIPRPTAKETADLYTRFLSAVWDTFAKYSGRDILSFRRIALILWPRFTAPVREGIYGPKEFQRLLVSQRPLFRDESLLIPSIIGTSLPTPPPTTSTPAQSQQITTTTSKPASNPLAAKSALPTPPLPYTSRLLLIAAYLASYTPARLDPIIFAKSSSLSKKRRKNLGGTATKPRPGTAARRRLNRKLLGPQAFVMERCLAIFWALRGEANAGKAESGGADVLASVATLGSLRLLGKTSRVVDPLEGGCKWKVNVGWEVVRGVGRSVGIEVEEWIVE
jgi:origin recognition complex subunit 5